MAKIIFKNRNGLRDPNRAIKNGLSDRVVGQVRALNGASYAKIANSSDQGNPDLTVCAEVKPTTIEAPIVPNTPASEAETKKLIEESSGGTVDTSNKGPDDKNPTAGTPTVGPVGSKTSNSRIYPHRKGNYQSALSAIRTKLVNDCADGDCDDDNNSSLEREGSDDWVPLSETVAPGDYIPPAEELVVVPPLQPAVDAGVTR